MSERLQAINFFSDMSDWAVTWIGEVDYPDFFDAVMLGGAYYNEPIKILGYYGKFGELGSYRIIDIDHPRCYYCGKFVKRGDWWKGILTGPCWYCDEDLRFIY